MISKLLMIQSDVAAAIDTMENATVATAGTERVTLWDMALNGGWIMLVLVLLLVLAIYIFIERYLTLNGALKGEADNSFMEQIRQYVHNGNVDEARRLAKETDTPLGRMISKGFSRLGRPLPDIQAAIENEGQLEVANLEKMAKHFPEAKQFFIVTKEEKEVIQTGRAEIHVVPMYEFLLEEGNYSAPTLE